MNPTAKISEDIKNEYIGGYPENLTKHVITACEYLAHQAAKECNLKAGQTALFWSLLAHVSNHIQSVKETPK